MQSKAEVKKEHELVSMICVAKLNEVFSIIDLYQNCEDKLHARLALKHAGMAVNTLIVNGHLPDNIQPAVPASVEPVEPPAGSQESQAPVAPSEEPSHDV